MPFVTKLYSIAVYLAIYSVAIASASNPLIFALKKTKLNINLIPNFFLFVPTAED